MTQLQQRRRSVENQSSDSNILAGRQSHELLDTQCLAVVENATSVNDHGQAETPRRRPPRTECVRADAEPGGGRRVGGGRMLSLLSRYGGALTRRRAHAAPGGYARRGPGGHGHHSRHGQGSIGRRAARCHGHHHARGPGLHPHHRDARGWHLHLHAGAHRRLHGPGRVPRLPQDGAAQHRRQHPAAARRSTSRSSRATWPRKSS